MTDDPNLQDDPEDPDVPEQPDTDGELPDVITDEAEE